MAKYFLIGSIIALLATAGLGFVAKGNAEKKIAELKETTKKYNETDQKLKSTDTKLKSTTEELDASKKTVDEQRTQIADLDKKATDAKDEAKKSEDAAKEKETLLASVQKDYDDYKTKHPENAEPGKIIGGVDNPVVKELEDAKKALAEANVMKENFQSREKAAEENLVAAQKRIKQYEDRVAVTGLTGRVVTVNQGWNFVVLDIGDKQGVTVNSPLLVVRGGQRVANLKITSVEPRTSIADVVPGTMARGQAVQAGDRVVFAGTRGEAAPQPLGGAGGPEPAPPPATALPQ